MNIWLENSKRNLLALSLEKENFTKALKEWSYTGSLENYHDLSATCELCEKDELRYHFEIKNDLNNTLLVGSKCIEKFDIAVFDDDGTEVKQGKNSYLLRQARKKHIKEVFNKLKMSPSEEKIKGNKKSNLDISCIKYYDIFEDLDAKMLNYLFLRFDEERIFYFPKFFKINIRSFEQKNRLLKLNKEQFERIKGALKASQIKYYNENKNK